MQTKLRCLKVGKYSHFFVGDICDVTKNENGSMTVYNTEGQKRVAKYSFRNKDVMFDGNLFRMRCIPSEAL